MARSHLRWQFGAWRKPEHRDTTKDARLLYMTICADEMLNQAGVAVLRTSVWAEDSGLSDDELDKAMVELEHRRFIVIDHRTCELLVRTFIRNDHVDQQPNVLRNALSCAELIRSDHLRRVMAAELRRLDPAPPSKELKSGRIFHYPDPHQTADRIDPDGPQPGAREPVDNPGGNPDSNPSQNPSGNPSNGRVPGTLGGSGRGSGSSSRPVDGDLGGRAHTREATPHDPPCETPCRRCQAARLATEAAQHAASAAISDRLAAEQAARRACRLCDGDGWTWHDPNGHHHGVTNQRCDHRPHLTAVQEATA